MCLFLFFSMLYVVCTICINISRKLIIILISYLSNTHYNFALFLTKNIQYGYWRMYNISLSVFFLFLIRFKLKVSYFLLKCSFTWVTPPVLCDLAIFQAGLTFLPRVSTGPWFSYLFIPVTGMTGAAHHTSLLIEMESY
jgi:hypothetical protein